MLSQFFKRLEHDLTAPIEVRGFGSGWFSGFFALLFAISGFAMVMALRYPEWFAMPELQVVKNWAGFRGAVHADLAGLLCARAAQPAAAAAQGAWRNGADHRDCGGIAGRLECPAERDAELGHLLRARLLHRQSAGHRLHVRADRALLAASPRPAIVPHRMARGSVLFSGQHDAGAALCLSGARPAGLCQCQYHAAGMGSAPGSGRCPGWCNSFWR